MGEIVVIVILGRTLHFMLFSDVYSLTIQGKYLLFTIPPPYHSPLAQSRACPG